MKKSKAVVKIKDKDVIYIKPEIKCLIKYLERTENGLLRQPFVPQSCQKQVKIINFLIK